MQWAKKPGRQLAKWEVHEVSIREVLGEILGLLSLLAIEVNCQLQLVVSPVDVPAAAYYLDDISYSHGTEIIMFKGK